MSVYVLLGGAIVAAVGVILEGISASISGIQSTKEDDTGTKQTLLAASATVGFGTILFIISLVLLFLYQTKSKAGKPPKGLLIAALIFGILGLILLIIGAVICGVKSTQFTDPVVSNALKTAGILVAIGILLLIIGYIIIYLVLGKRLKKFSKAT